MNRSLQSLNQVLGGFEAQHKPPEQKYLQCVLQRWPEVVGSAIAAQTQPHSIQRGVLWVTTSSSVWAQNLVFERHRILVKLNALIPRPLTDIRFSAAQWQSTQKKVVVPGVEAQTLLWQDHPSRLAGVAQSVRIPSPQQPLEPIAAFQNWSAHLRSRLQHLPLCPQCQCPTPHGELSRWNVCSVCVTKQWQQ